MAIIILPMHQEDIKIVAKIHAEQFPRQQHSEKWVRCNFAAFPRIRIFVARDEKDKVIGYVQWIHKSGFRKESVIEIEQIAVTQMQQGKGIGSKLIKESLASIKNSLSDNGSLLKSIIISTRTDNKAQKLYKQILNAEEVATIKDLYSDDEVILRATIL